MKFKFAIFQHFIQLNRNRTGRIAFIFLFLGISSFWAPGAVWGEEKEILLVHSNNVTGHLFPCPT